MPLTSSVMGQSISNFRLYCCSKKIQMFRKKVKLLLEQLQVCIFAKIVFGVRCTLKRLFSLHIFKNRYCVQSNQNHDLLFPFFYFVWSRWAFGNRCPKSAGPGRRLASYLSSIAAIQNADFTLSHSADHIISVWWVQHSIVSHVFTGNCHQQCSCCYREKQLTMQNWVRSMYINHSFHGKLLYLMLFCLYPSLFWELRDKRSLKNLHFSPESLGAMLEYW